MTVGMSVTVDAPAFFFTEVVMSAYFLRDLILWGKCGSCQLLGHCYSIVSYEIYYLVNCIHHPLFLMLTLFISTKTLFSSWHI